MSYRDFLWFLAGTASACAVLGITLWLAEKPETSSALPAWHPVVGATPSSAEPTLHARAEQMRRERNYAAAREAYAQLASSGQMTADAWADYADVVASLQNGRLAGEPAELISTALRVDPDHPKALWLKASLAHQERRFQDALVVWRRLQDVLPATSPDRKIIEENMKEASRLAQSAPASALSISLGREFD